MNWFKRIALVLSLPLMLAGAANKAEARSSQFILNYEATGSFPTSALPVATFLPGGQSCQLGSTLCSYDPTPGQTLTISLALPQNVFVVGWQEMCTGAGTSSRATITIPASSASAPTCKVILAYGDQRPLPPAPQNGWWWNPQQSGSGYAIAVNARDEAFVVLFGYRDNGEPLWRMARVTRAADVPANVRAYNGPLQEIAGGGTLAGGEPGNITTVDQSIRLQLVVFSESTAQLRLYNAATGEGIEFKSIQRFPINGQSVVPTPAGTLPTGWYWNPNQQGVGYFIEQQGSEGYVGSFAYDGTGRAIWYTSRGTVLPTAGGFQMDAELNSYTGGSSFTARPPFRTPTKVRAGDLTTSISAAPFLQLSSGRRIALHVFNW